jgi:glycosyltransferase involved in cell wall biosynthesis
MKNISIIIPAYNEEIYIAKCLNAVVLACDNYSGKTEIIVVDNKSSDKTVEIAKTFNINVISSSSNTPAGVRNEGAKLAQYEIYGFIDGDCVISTDWLTKVSLAYNEVKTGAYGGEHTAPIDDPWVVTSWNPVLLKQEYNNSAKLPGGNLTIRSNIFKKLKGFNEQLTSAEDDFISMQVINLGFDCILDNDLAVVHHGYPKTLLEVYRKQVWHGSTQIRAHGLLKDKMLLITQIWFLSWMLMVYSLLIMNENLILISFLVVISGPLMITLNRLKYHRNINFNNLFLSFYIAIFFITGRMIGLIKEIFSLSIFAIKRCFDRS